MAEKQLCPESNAAVAPRSGAGTGERAPWNAPIGVRLAEAMTMLSSDMFGYLLEGKFRRRKGRSPEQVPGR